MSDLHAGTVCMSPIIYSVGDKTYSQVHARQTLYPLSHSPILQCLPEARASHSSSCHLELFPQLSTSISLQPHPITPPRVFTASLPNPVLYDFLNSRSTALPMSPLVIPSPAPSSYNSLSSESLGSMAYNTVLAYLPQSFPRIDPRICHAHLIQCQAEISSSSLFLNPT